MTTGAILATVRHGDDTSAPAVIAPACGDALEEIAETAGVEPECGARVGGPGTRAEVHAPLEPAGTRDESVSRFKRFKSPRNSAAV